MRDIKPNRIVVKVGTNTICKDDGTVDQDYVEDIARQVVELDRRNIQSIIVTSGAIGSGSSELGLNGKRKDIAEKQAWHARRSAR
jgi:glutamate 5-kinase